MNRDITNACCWMLSAAWAAFLAGYSPTHWVTVAWLVFCAASVIVAAVNLEAFHYERNGG